MHGERTDRRYKLYIKTDMERKKITFDSFIRGSIGCVLVVGILMLVERLSGVLLPFFIAWLIAYMVYPLVKFFQYKLRLKSRIVSIFCALDVYKRQLLSCSATVLAFASFSAAKDSLAADRSLTAASSSWIRMRCV